MLIVGLDLEQFEYALNFLLEKAQTTFQLINDVDDRAVQTP